MSISAGLPSSDVLRALRQLPGREFHTFLCCAMVPSIGPELLKGISPGTDWEQFSALVYALDLGLPTDAGELSIPPAVATAASEEAVSRGLDLMEIHREIGTVFEAQQQSLEALRQFIIAKDNVSIARLLDRHSQEWALSGNIDEVLRAHKILGSDPRLSGGLGMLDSAWASIAAGQIERARAQLGLARELLGTRLTKEARTSQDLADGFVAYELGDFSLAIQCAERVLMAGDVHEEQIVAANWLKGLAAFRMRDPALLAITAFDISDRVTERDLPTVLTRRSLRAMSHALEGEAQLALDAAEEVLLGLEQVTPQRHFYPMDALLVRTWALRALGREADAIAALSTQQAHLAQNDSALNRIEWLRMSAELALDRADEVGARRNLKELRSIADAELSLQEAMHLVDHLEAVLRLRMGDFARAAALAARGVVGVRRDLVQIQVLAQSRPDLAFARLRTLRATAPLDSLSVEIVLADLQRRLGNPREAEAAVSRAFTLAEPTGLVAPLAYAAVDLAPMILQVASARGDVFAERVAERLQTRLDRLTQSEPGSAAVTKRELSIMRLLGAGLGPEKVAEHLGISAETVKSHASHVSRKLGVKSRSEALSILRDRGLL